MKYTDDHGVVLKKLVDRPDLNSKIFDISYTVDYHHHCTKTCWDWRRNG